MGRRRGTAALVAVGSMLAVTVFAGCAGAGPSPEEPGPAAASSPARPAGDSDAVLFCQGTAVSVRALHDARPATDLAPDVVAVLDGPLMPIEAPLSDWVIETETAGYVVIMRVIEPPLELGRGEFVDHDLVAISAGAEHAMPLTAPWGLDRATSCALRIDLGGLVEASVALDPEALPEAGDERVRAARHRIRLQLRRTGDGPGRTRRTRRDRDHRRDRHRRATRCARRRRPLGAHLPGQPADAVHRRPRAGARRPRDPRRRGGPAARDRGGPPTLISACRQAGRSRRDTSTVHTRTGEHRRLERRLAGCVSAWLQQCSSTIGPDGGGSVDALVACARTTFPRLRRRRADSEGAAGHRSRPQQNSRVGCPARRRTHRGGSGDALVRRGRHPVVLGRRGGQRALGRTTPAEPLRDARPRRRGAWALLSLPARLDLARRHLGGTRAPAERRRHRVRRGRHRGARQPTRLTVDGNPRRDGTRGPSRRHSIGDRGAFVRIRDGRRRLAHRLARRARAPSRDAVAHLVGVRGGVRGGDLSLPVPRAARARATRGRRGAARHAPDGAAPGSRHPSSQPCSPRRSS